MLCLSHYTAEVKVCCCAGRQRLSEWVARAVSRASWQERAVAMLECGVGATTLGEHHCYGGASASYNSCSIMAARVRVTTISNHGSSAARRVVATGQAGRDGGAGQTRRWLETSGGCWWHDDLRRDRTVPRSNDGVGWLGD